MLHRDQRFSYETVPNEHGPTRGVLGLRVQWSGALGHGLGTEREPAPVLRAAWLHGNGFRDTVEGLAMSTRAILFVLAVGVVIGLATCLVGSWLDGGR